VRSGREAVSRRTQQPRAPGRAHCARARPRSAARSTRRTFNLAIASAPRDVLWGIIPRTVFQKMRLGARQCQGPPRRGLLLLFFFADSSHLSLLR